jgi:hypothetical protein
MGGYQDGLTVDGIQGRDRGRGAHNGLELERTVFVRKINEMPHIKIEEVKIVAGLNSVLLIELAHRLELHHDFAFDDEVSPDIAHVLSLIEHWDYPLRLVIDETVT